MGNKSARSLEGRNLCYVNISPAESTWTSVPPDYSEESQPRVHLTGAPPSIMRNLSPESS